MEAKNKERYLKRERILNVNEFLELIASCGKRFFEYNHELGSNVARLGQKDNGHLYFFEPSKLQWYYVSRSTQWRWFRNGETLRWMIQSLIGYIKNGESFACSEAYWSHWGYGKDTKTVIDCGVAFGVIKSPRQIK
jgi:hypothetical protein